MLLKSKTSNHRRALTCLLLLLALGLYGYAFREVSVDTALIALTQWQGNQILVLFIVNAGIIATMILRWWLILHRLGYPLNFLHLTAYRIGANAISFVTPGPQFGGEPWQVLMLTDRHGLPPADATASVVIDRLIELVFNCGILLLSLSLLVYLLPAAGGLRVESLVALAMIVFGVGWYLIAIAKGSKPLSKIASALDRLWPNRSWLEQLALFGEHVEQRAVSIFRQPPSIQLAFYGNAIVQWILIITEFSLLYRFSGLPLSIVQLLAVIAAARLAFLLPLPGGIGALEASQVFILGTLGLDPAVGLAVCLIMRARDILLVGWGLGLAGLWYYSDRQVEPIPLGLDTKTSDRL
jgi:uncharacterized protein (TIRG00374 family)